MKENYFGVILAFLVILGLSSCEQEFDKYYTNDESKQSICGVLEAKGNYGLFLAALDKAGYKEILSSSGLFTLLAVDDEVFQEFLSTEGFGDINAIPEEELKRIVSYHIIDWAYSADELTSGYSSAKLPMDPLMIRKLTRTQPLVYSEKDAVSGLTRSIASERKYLSFFSQEYLETMGISASDVLAFLPNVEADFEEGDIIASEAIMVTQDMPALNGWVHQVDRVLQPIENQQELLFKESDYSSYVELAKLFVEYEFDQGYTDELKIDADGNGDFDSVFVKKWFELNREYVGIKGNNVSQKSDIIKVQRNFVTTFIPNNAAVNQFFNEYYPDIEPERRKEDIALPALKSIVSSCIFSGDAYFPSYASSGLLKSKFGIPYIVSESDIVKKELVSNGLFYGINQFRVPDEFNALTSEFMTDSTYSYFLVALDNAGLLKLLVTENIDFTVFAVKNQVFRETGFFLNELQSGFVDEDGNGISNSQLLGILRNHISMGKTDIGSIERIRFIRSIDSRESYIRLSQGIVSANGVDISNLKDEGKEISNGLIYEVDNFLMSPDMGIAEYLRSASNFSTFYNKLVEAGIVNHDAKTLLFNEGDLTCFAPTNEALNGVEWPEEEADMIAFLSRFFVKEVIFTDGQVQGQYDTYSTYQDAGIKKYLVIDITVNEGVISIVNGQTNASAEAKADDDVMLRNGVIHSLQAIY